MVIQTNLHRKKYLWQQNSGRAKSISVYHKWKPKIKKKGHSFTIEVCLSNRKDKPLICYLLGVLVESTNFRIIHKVKTHL